jgi:hypothetical protein
LRLLHCKVLHLERFESCSLARKLLFRDERSSLFLPVITEEKVLLHCRPPHLSNIHVGDWDEWTVFQHFQFNNRCTGRPCKTFYNCKTCNGAVKCFMELLRASVIEMKVLKDCPFVSIYDTNIGKMMQTKGPQN